MKKKNLLLTFLLTALILGGGHEAMASTEIDGIYYNLNKLSSGDYAQVTYPTSGSYTGNIVIPYFVIYEDKTYPVKEIGPNAFKDDTGVTSVSIPESVVLIDQYAFSGCTGLGNIIIPTSVTNIAKEAFKGCSSLSSIVIPSNVTSMSTSIFENCTGLTSVIISTGITSINENTFKNCSNISSVIIPSTVSNISNNAFLGTTKLSEVIMLPTTPPTLGGSNAFNQKSWGTNPPNFYVLYNLSTTYKNETGVWKDSYASKVYEIPNNYRYVNGAWSSDAGGTPTSTSFVTIEDDITLTSDLTIADLVIYNGILTIDDNTALNVTGTATNPTAANLVIEDGGQLICNNAVQATVKKSVSHSGGAKDAANWYTIASPINTPTFDKVTNLIQDPATNYDLFRYNETTSTWENNLDPNHPDFTTLENGRGYLYWNSTGAELSFAGEVNASDVIYHLTYGAKNNNIKGFNLIGNPFTHNIYKGTDGAISDSRLAAGFYVLNNASGWSAQLGYNTPIVPGQGILVEATETFDLTITNTNAASTDDTRSSSNDLITFNVANDKYEDVAYVQFKDAIGLNKIEHLNAEIPMLYVHQNDADYAIANMDREVASFDLNFVAATAGEYTINAKAEGQFEYFHLIDRISGKDIDMLTEGKYTFTADPNDYEYRFIVKLSEEANDDTNLEMGDDFAFINNGQLIVNGAGTVQIIDMTGRVVSTKSTEERISTDGMTKGVYVLRLIGNETKTQKIVIK